MTHKEALEILQEEHDYCQEPFYVIAALQMAIKALEKQIPKKPFNIEGDYTASYGNCPNCENIVCDNEDYKYCNECGQSLDWSDTE